jgi:hypothetical protein
MLEMSPDDRVVMHDRVVVEDGAGDGITATQDGQPPQGVVGREERAADADAVMHRDDLPHALDLVGVVEHPGVAHAIEQDVEREVLAHALVLVLAGAGHVGELLGQLHRADAADVPAGRAGTRVAALDDDDVAHAQGDELAGDG